MYVFFFVLLNVKSKFEIFFYLKKKLDKFITVPCVKNSLGSASDVLSITTKVYFYQSDFRFEHILIINFLNNYILCQIRKTLRNGSVVRRLSLFYPNL